MTTLTGRLQALANEHRVLTGHDVFHSVADDIAPVPMRQNDAGQAGHDHAQLIDTLEAYRKDYDILRRFAVGVAEGFINEPQGSAILALKDCSATYLPPGHPDRSH